MDKDKSIIEKFTDTAKDIASSASEALKSEEPPKVEQTNAAYMPFAAEGLVSDPLLIPPVAVQPPRRKRLAKKNSKTSSARKTAAKRAAPKKARKAAKTASSRSKARSAAKASAKRTTKRARTRKSAKRSTRRGQR